MSNSSIGPIDKTLSDANTPCQSGPGSDGYEGVPSISKSSKITGALPSDCLVSNPGHSLEMGHTPRQKFSHYILELKPTGLYRYKSDNNSFPKI